MATARQKLSVLKIKNGNKNALNLSLFARTGYSNVWINGTHYYYDERYVLDSTKQIDMHNYMDFTGKKGIVVVTRRSPKGTKGG